MATIHIEEEAFYALFEKLIQYHDLTHSTVEEWLSTENALRLLNVKSKGHLQKLRDDGEIEFSQPNPKNISYSRSSIIDYHQRHVKRNF